MILQSIKLGAADYAYDGGFSRPDSSKFAIWWTDHKWDKVSAWNTYNRDEIRKDLLEWRRYKL